MVLTEMDIDVWEVIAAASTKPFGYQPFYPGPGLGGHCIPIDPFYLAWKARELGISTHFIESAAEIIHSCRSSVLASLITIRSCLPSRRCADTRSICGRFRSPRKR